MVLIFKWAYNKEDINMMHIECVKENLSRVKESRMIEEKDLLLRNKRKLLQGSDM